MLSRPRNIRGKMHPPFFFVLAKKNAPCTVEEKAVSSKLARSGKFGDADGCWPRPDKTRRVSSEYAETLLSNYTYAASCDASANFRVLVDTPCFSFRCRSGDGFQRKGPQPLPSGRSGKGSRGKPSRKGFPLASLWGRPVSLGERNGSHTLRSDSLR